MSVTSAMVASMATCTGWRSIWRMVRSTILSSEALALISTELLLTSAVTRIFEGPPERRPSVSPIAALALALSLVIEAFSAPKGELAPPPLPPSWPCWPPPKPDPPLPEAWPDPAAGLPVWLGAAPLGSSASLSDPPPEEPPDPNRSFSAEATVLACAYCNR